jgi:hypothetical protein
MPPCSLLVFANVSEDSAYVFIVEIFHFEEDGYTMLFWNIRNSFTC